MAVGNIEIKVEGAAAALEAERVKKSLKEVDSAAKGAQGTLGSLNSILKQTEKVSSSVSKQTQATEKGFSGLQKSSRQSNILLTELNKNIQRLVEQSSKMSVSLRQMSSGMDQLTSGTQRAGGAAGSASGQFGRFSSQMSITTQGAIQLNRVMMAFGQGLSLAYAIKTLTEFDHTMAAVAAVSRATGAQLDSLRNKAKELGSVTIYTSGEAAEAMRFLAQSGFQVNEILSASAGVLALAQAGNMGIAETSEIAAKALRGFRLEATQMDDVADVMAVAITQSTMNLRELGDAFKYVAPIAASLGVDMRTAAAYIGVLSDAGIDATMAGTSLRRIFSELSNPTIKATKLIKTLGLTMQDLDVQSLGLNEVMYRLIKSGIDVGDAFALFGDRGAVAFTTISQQMDVIEAKMKGLENITGRAAEMQKIMAQSLYAVWKELTSALEFFLIQGAETSGLLTGIKTALHDVAGVIRNTVNNLDAFYPILAGIASLLSVKLVGALVNLVKWFGALGTTGKASLLGVAATGNAVNAMLTGMGVKAAVASRAVGILSGVLNTLGGPIGLAIAGLTYYLTQSAMETGRATDLLNRHAEATNLLKRESQDASAAVKILTENLKGLSVAELEKKIQEEQKTITDTFKEIEEELKKVAGADYQTILTEMGTTFIRTSTQGEQLVHKIRDLYAQLQQDGDINKFQQGMNRITTEAKNAKLNISDNIVTLEQFGRALWASITTVDSATVSMIKYKDSISAAIAVGKDIKQPELLDAKQMSSMKDEIKDLMFEMNVMKSVPKDQQAAWISWYKLMGDSIDGLIIDWNTLQITIDSSVVSLENAADHLKLITQLLDLLKQKETFKAAEKGSKGYSKSLKEVTKELDRLLMTDKQFERMESERQLAEFEKVLGKTNPKVVQFRTELERAFAAGFSSVKEVAKTREEVDKMIKKTELGDLGFALYEIDEKYENMKKMYKEGEAGITAITEAQAKERNDKIREYKDKDLQTQMSFWNEYINLVGAYGGPGYQKAIEETIKNQSEVFRIAKIGEVEIAKWAEMKKLEYSTDFNSGLIRGFRKTMASYENEAALMENAWNTTVGAMEDTLADWLYSGELSFQSFVDTVGKMLAKLAIQMMVLKPLLSGISGTGLGSFFGFANGGVFSRGSITPFASGGIVSSPTIFPMKSGAGLMGEAGPEAIMPLVRLPSGRMGVEATGGGGNVVMQNQNIITFQGSVQQGSQQAGGDEKFAELLTEKIYTGMEEFVLSTMIKAQRPGGVLYRS